MKKILIFCIICFATVIVASSFKDAKSVNQGFGIHEEDATMGLKDKAKAKAKEKAAEEAIKKVHEGIWVGKADSAEECSAMAKNAGYPYGNYTPSSKNCFGSQKPAE
ncbi:MAG: hypothetical protein FWH53_10265 [Leptospirales bacterium]|nr:hypothetical protein [Leptospirales bacterium]